MNRTLQSPDSNSCARTSHDRFLPRFVGRPIALPAPQFLDAIHQERRRSERSTKPFVLMLARLQYPPKGEAHSRAVRKLVTVLRDEGCQVLDKVEESEFGIFGWVMDPEGNKVELWQPPKGQ